MASDFFAGSARKGVPGLVASVLMQANPFMLYAGEEYGERGMDEEGFSGRDGRTTIFDYWSIDTLSRVSDLTAEELYIYQLHKKVLGIARKEKAIDGDFYDMMYVNPSSPRFNEYGQFAFLRKNGGEILLIVCNFIGNAVDIDVKIPAHAVEFLGIPEKNYKAKDLLSDDIMDISIKGDSVVKMLVPANSARIWKFSYRQTRK